MRNKVNNQLASRLLAVVLTLVMTAGTFSVSVFAEEIPAETPAQETEQQTTQNAAGTGSSEAGAAASENGNSESAAVTAETAQPAQDAPEAVQGTSETPAEAAPETQTAGDAAGEAAAETAPSDADAAGNEAGSAFVADAETETNIAAEAEVEAAAETGSEAEAEKAEAEPQAAVRSLTAQAAPEKEQLQVVKASVSEPKAADLSMPEYLLIIYPSGVDAPDNFSMTLNVTSTGPTKTYTISKSDVNPTVLSLVEGAVLVVKEVKGLTDEYQQGDTPNGKKQLRLVFTGKNRQFFAIALNNSEMMRDDFTYRSDTEAQFRMPAYSVTADLMTAYRNIFVPAKSQYNRGTCTISNLSDTTCEFHNIFALPGQNVQVSIDYEDYDKVDVSVTDSSGNVLPVSNGVFTMPDSPSNINVVYYHKPVKLTVRNPKPERGTVSTEKSEYRPGDKVIVNMDAAKGYTPKSLVMTYTVSGKVQAQKLEKDENGEYSFIMPFYSPTLTGIFAEKSTSSSVSSAAVSYAAPAVAALAEEPAEPEEEKQLEMIDVMPTVAAVMANTMLVVTTTVNMM